MSLERKLSADKKQLTVVADEIFDFGKVQDFRIAFSTDIDEVETVIIDLHKTAYMDSSALGMLLNMQKLLSGKVTIFKIVNTRPQVLKILRIARFDKKFLIS
ncbi:STAS domain-containing protein [Paraglaciecola sp. L1A13]|uniref:STAS domain-containing protein n=1 Tax=Paraglaciecola sp. L1A13 TaxID=2686359 RepID=UPI00131E3E4F|nr:STAS domain-containing protein [Paraglaciecola sp. L1A13]|tara:strand:- start:297 stop:602 length:306 start_codon:yes stop_codon:yes gene_type:complete